jgi:hypothetical protein
MEQIPYCILNIFLYCQGLAEFHGNQRFFLCSPHLVMCSHTSLHKSSSWSPILYPSNPFYYYYLPNTLTSYKKSPSFTYPHWTPIYIYFLSHVWHIPSLSQNPQFSLYHNYTPPPPPYTHIPAFCYVSHVVAHASTVQYLMAHFTLLPTKKSDTLAKL